MKHILIKIIENSKFIRKLYLRLFNDGVIDKSYLFPGYYFRNNTYMIEKGSCSIFYGTNTKIHGVKIICNGVGNKIFLGDFWNLLIMVKIILFISMEIIMKFILELTPNYRIVLFLLQEIVIELKFHLIVHA